MTQDHGTFKNRRDGMALQSAYCATQTDVLAALDALRRAVLNHGPAPDAHYHWGHVGDMNALLQHLQQLPIVLPGATGHVVNAENTVSAGKERHRR